MNRKSLLLPGIILLFLGIWNIPVYGQISEGGVPSSFANKNTSLRQSGPIEEIPVDFDVESLIKEDKINQGNGQAPRIGVNIPVDLNMNNSGEWITLPEGKEIWRLTIRAQGALALMLGYDEFYIPEGGKLFIYNEDKSQVLGAYTCNTNTFGKSFATEFVTGDMLTLEYEKPQISDPNIPGGSGMLPEGIKNPMIARIAISGVGYGYNNIRVYGSNQLRIGESGNCQVNINCKEGENWQEQKRGVGKTIYIMKDTRTNKSYYYYCSGSLVNNTKKDCTPYWLSAQHCFDGADEDALNKMIFYFHYEHPGCENLDQEPLSTKTVVGATRLVEIPLSGMSDGALLRINQAIPVEYGVFYNGWDRSNTASLSGVGIHHPNNDVKKISTFTSPASSVQWNAEGVSGAKNAHWNVIFSQTENGHSVTEGGSSGSPLFNQNGYIVGTLTGGSSSCSRLKGANYYGKLWYHWDQVSDPGKQMKKYLAPDNSSATSLPGIFQEGAEAIANFAADKTAIYASESVSFSNYSFGAKTYKWLFPGGTPSTSIQKNPPAVRYNNPGVYDVTLILNEGLNSEVIKTYGRYIAVTQKTNNCTKKTDIVLPEKGVAEFPLGIRQKQSMSASIYKASEINQKSCDITGLVWNATKGANNPRSLQIYMKETEDSGFSGGTGWNDEIQGATLVYNGDNSWSNVAGENTIRLDIPFAYSGNKNLKIMVRAVARDNSNFSSAGVGYAEVSNAHMQWTSNQSDIPVSPGTVNNNRPNIRLVVNTCPAIKPVADFSLYEDVVLKENFDEPALFPAKGWELENRGTSPQEWKLNNVRNEEYNFNTIDPESAYSAFVAIDEGNPINTWLKTPEVKIPENGILEFYAAYGSSNLSKGILVLYVSSDNGDTWLPQWTTGLSGTSDFEWNWYKQTIDLSQFAGSNLKFAWQYSSDGKSDIVGLDGIKVYARDKNKAVDINEGESVQFTDWSVGPPVTWEWSFPGGSPEKSTERNPKVKYMHAGRYGATLTVTSNLGTDTKLFPSAVLVKRNIPEADFISSGGYTRMNNYGQFIPVGGYVSFRDQSGNYPDSWEWTMNGSDPSSSDSTVVEKAVYKTEGEYDVSLKVSNAAGDKTVTVKGHTLVGHTMEKVWNMPKGDPGMSDLKDFFGNITGYTTRYEAGVAERFDAPQAPIGISRIYIRFKKGDTNAGKLDISVYSEGSSKGWLGKRIGQKSIFVSEVVASGYTPVDFPEPIGISGAFYVVVSGFDSAKDIVVLSSEKRKDANTAYAYYGTESLVPFNSFYLWGLSLNIVPNITYSTLEIDSDEPYFKSNTDLSDETVDVKSNVAWKATTTYPWIKLKNASGSGNGSLSFSLTESTDRSRTGTINIEGGGFQKEIIVEQSGPGITDLNVSKGTDDLLKLAWKPSPSEPWYFDDFEGHPSFAVNSAGSIGWKYLDGDKANTYDIQAFSFPNEGSKMAYIVFTPNETDPAIAYDTSFICHSGSKSLAAICNEGSVKNNDWLISPELKFSKPFTFSFWAKGRSLIYGSERIRVVYSTTDSKIESFVHVLHTGKYFEVPERWQNYQFTLPANAKYVAINCVSEDVFILMLDDIFIGTGDVPTVSEMHSGSRKTTKEEWKSSGVEKKLTTQQLTESSKDGMELRSQLRPNSSENTLKSEDGSCERIIRWDSGFNSGYSIGLEEGGEWTAAVKWTPSDLKHYDELRIKSIRVYIGERPVSCKLKVWHGNGMESTRNINPSEIKEYSFNDFTLSSPLLIDVTKELIVGLEFTNDVESYVAGIDDGPAKAGRNFIFMDNEWHDLEDFDDINWNMALIVDVKERPEFTYNVYRDNKLIAEGLTKPEYTDNSAEKPNWTCYTVSALYKNGAESSKSKAACFSYTDIPDVQNDGIRVYPNPVTDELKISGDRLVLYVRVTDVAGKVVYEKNSPDGDSLIIPAQGWNAGTYIVYIKTEAGIAVHKILKK